MPEAPSPPPLLSTADADRLRRADAEVSNLQCSITRLRDDYRALRVFARPGARSVHIGADFGLKSTLCALAEAADAAHWQIYALRNSLGVAGPAAAAPRPPVADAATGSEDDAAADQDELRRDLAEFGAAVADDRAPTDDEIDRAALDAAFSEAVLGAMEDATGHIGLGPCS